MANDDALSLAWIGTGVMGSRCAGIYWPPGTR